MASKSRRRLEVIRFNIYRPSEYTRWRPRIDRGIGFTHLHWGIFSLAWDWAPPLSWSNDDLTSPPMTATDNGPFRYPGGV